jgi:16S rRNA (adenine(1408)-N(1))-methyltransferase
VIAPYGSVVLDIGTGDGRFVSSMAKLRPDAFFIGVDANAKPLEKPSMKATRKPAKGGLPNAMFVQAAVESLPEEFTGIASEIHINFPWGSLLRAAATGDAEILKSVRGIARIGAALEILLGVDQERDRAELQRLGIPQIEASYIRSVVIPNYESAGFSLIEFRELASTEWAKIETAWARKLSGNESRRVYRFIFRAT